jgi:hypothetical protein
MDPPAIDAAAPVQAALDLLARSRARVVFVTGGPTVRAIDLHRAAAIWNDAGPGGLGRTASCGAVAVAVPTATPDDSLLTLSEKLFEIDWGELPIVDADQPGRLVGVVSRRTLLATFDRELLRRDSLSTRVAWHEGQTETADFLELPPGHRVEIIAPPRAAVGRPVDVNGLRAREHVNLMAVRRFTATHRGEWTDAAAFPDDVRADDRWMVVGAVAAIDHLRSAGGSDQDSRRG